MSNNDALTESAPEILERTAMLTGQLFSGGAHWK